MNIQELIRELQKLDPDKPVFIQGYEGGVNDIKPLTLGTVSLNSNEDDYCGRHDHLTLDHETAEALEKGHTVVEGYIFPR